MRVLVYDTETGGLDAETHSLFSLGALVGDLDTGEIIDQFEAYHKLESVEDYCYTEKALSIHEIMPQEAFEKGVPTEELQALFSDLWFNNGAAIIGGHNEPYDRRFISRQLFGISQMAFEANFTYRALDSLPVLRLYAGHDNVASGASLKQAVKALKIDVSDFPKGKFHAALFDAVCTFRILHRFRTVFSNPQFGEALISG